MNKMVCTQCGKRYPYGATVCDADGTTLTLLTEDPFLGYEFDKYRIIRRIGKGGFGVVYLAEHVKIHKQFAVKVLRKQFLTDEQLVNRFLLEANIVGKIDHENIVQIMDYGDDENLGYYYVMEYLEGRTLTEVMKAYPRGMPIERALPILRHICSALDQAHHLNVVHRDLKPSNILLIKRFDQNDVVKILDFGIAKVLEGQDGGGMTVTGQIVGSPRFMSPEQARGRHTEVDARSDIYSLGVMLYWMLTGKLPFDSKKLARLLFMHVKVPAPPLCGVPPERHFPPALEQVVASALAKSKEERPGSAGQLYRNVEAACHGVVWEDTNPVGERLFEGAQVEGGGSLSAPPEQGTQSSLSNTTPAVPAAAYRTTPLAPAFFEEHGATMVVDSQDQSVDTPSGASFSYQHSLVERDPPRIEAPWLASEVEDQDSTIVEQGNSGLSSFREEEEVAAARYLHGEDAGAEAHVADSSVSKTISQPEVVPEEANVFREQAIQPSERSLSHDFDTDPRINPWNEGTATLVSTSGKKGWKTPFLFALLSLLVAGLAVGVWWALQR